jgi:hypothetical protein
VLADAVDRIRLVVDNRRGEIEHDAVSKANSEAGAVMAMVAMIPVMAMMPMMFALGDGGSSGGGQDGKPEGIDLGHWSFLSALRLGGVAFTGGATRIGRFDGERFSGPPLLSAFAKEQK